MQPALGSIQKLLREKLNISSKVITPKTEFKRDLELVDWELLYLLNAVEEACQVSLPMADTDKLVRIEHLLNAVRRQQRERKAA